MDKQITGLAGAYFVAAELLKKRLASGGNTWQFKGN